MPIVIGPEHLGKKIGVFLSVEMKADSDAEPDQIKWLNEIRAAGGIAFIARGPESIPKAWEFNDG